MNKTQLIGNLGQDAEIRSTQEGKVFLSFSVAVSDGYGENKKTLWFNCSGWGERFTNGNLVQHLKSGTKVYLEGKYSPSLYTRKADNTVDISHNFMLNQIELISSVQPAAQQHQNTAPGPAPVPNTMQQQPIVPMGQPTTGLEPNDDLPF